MDDLKIDDLRSLVSAERIIWTEHLVLSLRERNIKRDDVITCIQYGEIIEQYPDAYPYHACLVFAMLTDYKSLHVVCGIGDNNL